MGGIAQLKTVLQANLLREAHAETVVWIGHCPFR